MKKRRKVMPLWQMIFWCVSSIILIGVILVSFWGDKSWFTASAYLVAASAIAAGGCVAYHHLRVIQGTERANVLTNLDTSWMGPSLENSRIVHMEFRREYTAIPDIAKREIFIKDKLRDIRDNDAERYRTLLGMVCFFETIGYFSYMTYISLRDALEIYGPAIRDNDETFRGHILELQNKYNDKEIYAHFLWLADKARLKKS